MRVITDNNVLWRRWGLLPLLLLAGGLSLPGCGTEPNPDHSTGNDRTVVWGNGEQPGQGNWGGDDDDDDDDGEPTHNGGDEAGPTGDIGALPSDGDTYENTCGGQCQSGQTTENDDDDDDDDGNPGNNGNPNGDEPNNRHKPIIRSFTVTSNNGWKPGATVTATWRVTGASNCAVSTHKNGVAGAYARNPCTHSFTWPAGFFPANSNNKIVVLGQNRYGVRTAQRSFRIEPEAAPAPPPTPDAPTCRLSSSPGGLVHTDTRVTSFWRSSGATSCVIIVKRNGKHDYVSPQSPQNCVNNRFTWPANYFPVSGRTEAQRNFVIFKATNAGGTCEKKVEVQVIERIQPPPALPSVTCDVTVTGSGNDRRVAWESTNASSCNWDLLHPVVQLSAANMSVSCNGSDNWNDLPPGYYRITFRAGSCVKQRSFTIASSGSSSGGSSSGGSSSGGSSSGGSSSGGSSSGGSSSGGSSSGGSGSCSSSAPAANSYFTAASRGGLFSSSPGVYFFDGSSACKCTNSSPRPTHTICSWRVIPGANRGIPNCTSGC